MDLPSAYLLPRKEGNGIARDGVPAGGGGLGGMGILEEGRSMGSMADGRRMGYQRHSATQLGMRQRDWNWGDREKRRSAGSVPVFW